MSSDSKKTFPKNVILTTIILYSIISIKLFSSYYISEVKAYNNNYIEAINSFKYNSNNYYKVGEFDSGLKLGKYKSEEYYISRLYFRNDYTLGCGKLIKNFPISENYFLCGKIIYELRDKEIGLLYYNRGLEKLPDLWNSDSIYYDNFLLKNTISKHRFFSKKYSDLKNILETVNK